MVIAGRGQVVMRCEVIRDLQDMADSFHDQTLAWLRSVPGHVAKVYTQSNRLVQIPLLVWLLRNIHLPMIDTLADELSCGFATTGQLSPGAGWQPRLDDRYTRPVTPEVFC